MTRDEAWSLANHWVAAWNAHDLESIMEHYEDAIELTSPVAARLLGSSDGKVTGKANLRAYFQRGLEAYPELDFRLEDVLWGVTSVVLYYTNQKGTRTAEFMELSAGGKVTRVVRTTERRRTEPFGRVASTRSLIRLRSARRYSTLRKCTHRSKTSKPTASCARCDPSLSINASEAISRQPWARAQSSAEHINSLPTPRLRNSS